MFSKDKVVKGTIANTTKCHEILTIGNNVVIGAGSVVTHNIPDNVIAVGNPCQILREITEEEIKKEYMRKM